MVVNSADHAMRNPLRLSASILWLIFVAAMVPHTATGKECDDPEWYGDETLKRPKGDLVGFGKGDALDKAKLDARRDLGKQLTQKRSKFLFALPQVKSKVNTKVYSKAELTKAMALAVAYHLSDVKRLKFDETCDKAYVALTVTESKVAAALKQEQDLGEMLNAALGGKIDALEADRVAQEAQTAEQEFATPEAALKRIAKLIQSLNRDDFIEPLLAEPLRRKIDKLESKIKAAKAMPWSDQRSKALDELSELTVQGEKLSTAVREWQAQNFVSAFDIFHSLAVSGDETAQFVVGMMHVEAKGVRRDYKEALSWLKRAAAQGHGPAKLVIGVLHLSGQGVKTDTEEAKKWLDAGNGEGWFCEATVTMCKRRGQ